MEKEPPKASKPNVKVDEMSFLEHLEELRIHIFKGLIGIVIGTIVAFVFSDFVMDQILLGPTRSDFFIYNFFNIDAVDLVLQSRKLPGQFFTFFGINLLVGVIIGSPIFFWQMWKFFEPALDTGEKSKARFTSIFISSFFLLGVAFGYCVLVPFALQYFANFNISPQIRNDFDINEYFSSFSSWILACGIVFQMPVVSHFMSKAGFLTPDFLRAYRKHAIVLSLILGAILTPPDPLSQIMMAIPMLLLYELSIVISTFNHKKRQREIFGDNPPSDKPITTNDD